MNYKLSEQVKSIIKLPTNYTLNSNNLLFSCFSSCW